MTDADVQHCVDGLGIRTVIDLRAGHEVDQFSHGPLEATGVVFLHRPVVDETRREHVVRDPGAPAPELMSPASIYLMMLERFADRLTEVVRLIADPATHPVVFHCAAGKDRTGIVAALGARRPRRRRRHDRRRLRPHRRAHAASSSSVTAPSLPNGGSMPRWVTRTSRLRPRRCATSSWVSNAKHGGVEGYLLASGLEPAAIATLRRARCSPDPSRERRVGLAR